MNQPNAIDRHIGKRLRQLRLSREFDLPELASKAGVSAARLLQFEAGRARISAEVMRLLCKALDAPPSAFFAGFSRAGVRGADDAPPDAPTEREQEQRLLRDFARVRNRRSRELILALVAAYADFSDPVNGDSPPGC